MNKTELIDAVAEKCGSTKKNVREVLDALQDVTFDNISNEDIRIMDGVILYRGYQNARTCRNPKTGEYIEVAGKYVPKCRFGAAPKKAVAE